MRAIWKGAVAFGLVNVPVKLYAATGEKGVTLNQVHREDGGRIRYRKVCSVDGEEVPAGDIAKGYETDDGRMVVLTDEDMDALPLSTDREIAVEEFVPADQVDPIMLGRTYYLEPERTANKPYALLREALKTTDRMAVVKVALRQRESMAVLRVRGDVICLQTLLWPDEVREAEFPFLENEVQVRPQELKMAASLVESLAGDFDPSDFEDSYRAALEELIEAKVNGGQVVEVRRDEDDGDQGGEVVDLLSALQRSVERARGSRGAAGASDGDAPSKAAKASSSTRSGKAGTAKTSEAKGKGTADKGTADKGTASKSTRSKASPSSAAKDGGSTSTPAKGRATKAAPGAKVAAEEEKDGAAEKKPAARRTARSRAS